jgi:hypothetical protein
LLLDRGKRGGQGRGLAGARRTLNHHQIGAGGERAHDIPLYRIETSFCVGRDRSRACRRPRGAAGETGSKVGFDPENIRRGQRTDVLGHAGTIEQGDALVDRSSRQVLGQFEPNRRIGDDVRPGDELFYLASDVGGVPARAPHREPRQDLADRRVAVQLTNR